VRVPEAEIMARTLMHKHGLYRWSLIWTMEGIVAGRCFQAIEAIALSMTIIELNPIITVREIVLHEIAHALTDGGHTAAWRAMARQIGCTGAEVIVVIRPPVLAVEGIVT